MSEAVDRILSKLERVRQSGQGWIARCPAHNDRDPSLKIDEGDDGRELVKCHAGCFQEDIVQALGLTMPDLFERRNGGGGSGLLSSPEWFEHSNTSQKKQ